MERDDRLRRDAVFRFAARFVEDRLEGIERDADDYVALFPAYPDAIRAKFAELEREPSASESTHAIGPYRILSELGRGGQGVGGQALPQDRRVHSQPIKGLGNSELGSRLKVLAVSSLKIGGSGCFRG